MAEKIKVLTNKSSFGPVPGANFTNLPLGDSHLGQNGLGAPSFDHISKHFKRGKINKSVLIKYIKLG